MVLAQSPYSPPICYNALADKGRICMEQHESKSAAEWRVTTAREAKEKAAERQQKFVTSSDIEVPDLASEEDLYDFDTHDKLGYPGEFPFTRGIHPGMY